MIIGCSAPDNNTGSTPQVSDLATLPVSVISTTPANQMVSDELESEITPTPIPTVRRTLSSPTPLPSPMPTPTPATSPTPTDVAISLTLNLLAPSEGAGVEVGAVRVLGITSPDAVVTVNGTKTDVAPDGTFQRDLILQEGINSVMAVATGPSGDVASSNVVVLFVPRADEGVPLSILFPQGLEVSEPTITIIGATRQDAVLGVNGIPVDVNNLGIFSKEVPLELGVNLIEIVAVDLEENVNFQQVVVFYIP